METFFPHRKNKYWLNSFRINSGNFCGLIYMKSQCFQNCFYVEMCSECQSPNLEVNFQNVNHFFIWKLYFLCNSFRKLYSEQESSKTVQSVGKRMNVCRCLILNSLGDKSNSLCAGWEMLNPYVIIMRNHKHLPRTKKL